jgi:YD repeat-containing protein
MKIIIGYLSLIFLVLGCDKNSGSGGLLEIKSCQLTGITETSNGVSTSTQFFYNDRDLVDSEITGGQKTRYFYDVKGNIISSSNAKDNFSYTYDSIFVTSSIQVRNGVNYRKVIYKYTFGQMTTMESYVYASPSFVVPVLESITKYIYPPAPSRNYSSSTFTPVSGPVVNTTYEYDNKINPLQKLKFPTLQPDNNLISTIETIGSSNTTILYTYEYNTINYPFSRTASTGKKVTYTYDCK